MRSGPALRTVRAAVRFRPSADGPSATARPPGRTAPARPPTGTLAGSYSPSGEGKFFFIMMVAFAELERDVIVERTRPGLDAAKAQGRTGGRPTVVSEDVLTVARARKAKGESVSAIAKALGVSRATLYRHLEE
ncbi:helix-turn-helix domain-containing protein [Streptacidiphilus cavernicola]|uniref:Helix-turn-helix domain-containing protein n=1 Tax=Streptacidiphilus cavernicola TaxID=3342716 RepID=A0ABV6VRV4_9ACTN